MPALSTNSLSRLAAAAALLCMTQASWAASPVNGASLYGSNCASCHGSATSPGIPAVLRARNAESVLGNAINGGIPQMGFLSGLSASQIADIAAYLGNSPGSLNFAATAQGASSGTQTLTVRASDTQALSNLSATVTGDFIRQGGSCSSSLNAGASCTIDVVFKPTATGARTGSLNLSHSGIASGVTVALSGTGNAAPTAPVLSLGSAALSFSDQVVSTASAAQTINVANTGNAPLNFSGLAIGGTAAADFVRGGTCAVGTPLAAGGNCSLSVQFVPTAVGSRNATLSIGSDGGSGSVALSGSAVAAPAPQAVFSASSLVFGTQTVGVTSGVQTIKLSNPGSAVLSISSLQAALPFSLSHDCGNGLAPKASCTLSITFTPAGVGAASGKLSLVSNAAGSPHEVQVSGTGALAAPKLAWAGAVSSLSFGSSTVGSAAAMQTLTLNNQGPGVATLSAINLSGADAADFMIDGGSTCTATSTLAVNASCKLVLGFVPKATGARNASLSVASNGNTPGEIALSGNGVAPPAPMLTLSTKTISFARSADASSGPTQSLTLQNTGNAVLNVSSLAVKTGSFSVAPAPSAGCKAAPFVLAAGEQCAVQITWTGTAGTETGSIEIATNAAPAQETVGLSASKASLPEASNSGGGGCTIGQGTAARDPSLLLMAFGAAVMLWRRGRKAAPAQDRA